MTRAAALGVLMSLGCGIGVIGGEDEGAPDSRPNDAGSSIGSGGDGGLQPDAGGDAGGAAPPAGTAISLSRASSQFVNATNIPITNDFTLEAWVRPASLGSEMMIVAEDRAPLQFDNQFRLAVTAAGTPYFLMTDAGSNPHGLAADSQLGPFELSSAAPLVVGQWTHLAVTKSDKRFALYVDGRIAISLSATGNGSFTRSNVFDFRIGARMGNGGPANHFDGVIDEVRLYSIARSADDVAKHHASALTADSAARAGLVGYWRFDDGTGAIARDDVGAHDGTLMNGATWVPSTAF